MVAKGTLSHGRADAIFSLFDIECEPDELGRKLAEFWVAGEGRHRLLDPKITRIGVATCNFKGAQYWCAITR